MNGTRRFQVNFTISESQGRLLRVLAAKEMLKNPNKPCSASKIAGQIVSEYLEKQTSTEEETNRKE